MTFETTAREVVRNLITITGISFTIAFADDSMGIPAKGWFYPAERKMMINTDRCEEDELVMVISHELGHLLFAPRGSNAQMFSAISVYLTLRFDSRGLESSQTLTNLADDLIVHKCWMVNTALTSIYPNAYKNSLQKLFLPMAGRKWGALCLVLSGKSAHLNSDLNRAATLVNSTNWPIIDDKEFWKQYTELLRLLVGGGL